LARRIVANIAKLPELVQLDVPLDLQQLADEVIE
jgi:hypothetical protein